MVIKDKKVLENLVADHLSRLVNEEVTLKELEIRDEFPNESLLVVNERPWFADLANYKAAESFPRILIGSRKINSCMMLISMSGMIHICLKLELIIC